MLTEQVYLDMEKKSKEYSDSLPILIELLNKYFEDKEMNDVINN